MLFGSAQFQATIHIRNMITELSDAITLSVTAHSRDVNSRDDKLLSILQNMMALFREEHSPPSQFTQKQYLFRIFGAHILLISVLRQPFDIEAPSQVNLEALSLNPRFMLLTSIYELLSLVSFFVVIVAFSTNSPLSTSTCSLFKATRIIKMLLRPF